MKDKKEMITFKEGTIEQYLFDNCGVNSKILNLQHSLFGMKLDENEDLVFTLQPTMARKIYYFDLTDDSNLQSINYIDVILSSHDEDAFETVQNRVHINVNDYDESNEDWQFNLLCHICFKFFMYKFGGIKKLEDIDRPVPLPLFIKILNDLSGKEIAYRDNNGDIYAGILNHISIRQTMFSSNIFMRMVIVSRGKEGYVQGYQTFNLPLVPLAQTLEDIGLMEVTEELKKQLTERGKHYIEYTAKPTYCMCKGFGWRYGGWHGDVRVSLNGRVMIDANAMRTLNSEISDRWYKGSMFEDRSESHSENVDEDSLWMCSPVVYGFSFLTKTWVSMSIADTFPIEFSKTAFDELIIPVKYKRIFMACLTGDVPSFDSIEGKGSGKIFLLYGPPGCGKTMSAESVAEYLKRPLYNVSVGELGISPEILEERLEKVMEVAISWDAVVLLDEVDVFAVKRTDSDIKRNAMTAILLRLLERFSGVMFMTTNLKDNLDPAFISRALATIPYDDLGMDERSIIWRSLLKKATASGASVDDKIYTSMHELAAHALNGREIKNRVRLAYSIAMREEEPITMKTLEDVIEIKKVV